MCATGSEIPAARLLLITTPLAITTHTIVNYAHHLNPALHIIARAQGVKQTRELYDIGGYMVVLPEMEAGLEIARQTLLHLEVPAIAIQQYTDAVRRQVYSPIYQSNEGHELLTKLDNIKDMLEISWVALGSGSPLIDKSIKESAVRSRTGASIVGVLREKIFHSNPNAEYALKEGDLVAVVGNQQERNEFKVLSG